MKLTISSLIKKSKWPTMAYNITFLYIYVYFFWKEQCQGILPSKYANNTNPSPPPPRLKF